MNLPARRPTWPAWPQGFILRILSAPRLLVPIERRPLGVGSKPGYSRMPATRWLTSGPTAVAGGRP